MRLMEVGIRATALCLGIPDPTKPSERNWGNILKNIKSAIEDKSSKKTWTRPNEREFFDSAYVSLDAIRIAWRNTTMHVERIYTPEEAEHIFTTVRAFMSALSGRMDDRGMPLA